MNRQIVIKINDGDKETFAQIAKNSGCTITDAFELFIRQTLHLGFLKYDDSFDATSELKIRHEYNKKQQMEGIAIAKQEGRYKGRKPTVSNQVEKILELKDKGITPKEIGLILGAGQSSVYRVIAANRNTSR